MAEVILFDIVGELIKKLDSRVVQEIAFWWNVEAELAKLKRTFSEIRAVLLDAEQKSHISQVRDWLGKLQDVVYDADDLLDDFSTETLHRQLLAENKISKEVRIFFSGSNKPYYGLKMGHKVKAIRERLDEIADERSFHLEEAQKKNSFVSRQRQSTYSYVSGENVIGRDEDKEEIKKILLSSEENFLVVPIVGIGGLGKTTLAQLVYNDDTVRKSFDLRMWVCVSDPFDVKLIVEKMIKSATNEDLENLEMDQLHNCLQEKLDEKRYLLVLDDVWNENRNNWLYLESLLRGGKKGSRIIVTTRNEKVAQVVSDVKPHVLKVLSENEAWTLFKRLAFREGEEPTNEGVVDIGKKIVSKCAGVPLAIKTIGALLHFKNPEEWSSFENKEFSGITQQNDNILPTLKLSYDYLPSHLKKCFAYCSLFPKKYEIYVPKLIYFWMAQDFIQSSNKNQSCLENIGLEYFKELTWRSFFQEVKKNEGGNITYCKMHDLMHDLAISIGGIENIMLTSNSKCLNEKTRHVSFGFKIDLSWQIPTCFLKKNVIRTFLMPNQRSWEIDGECLTKACCNSIVLNSKCLRALEFHCLNLVNIPSSIGKLKHLRYLDLSQNSKLEILPSSVTDLQNLQVLKLLDCYKLKRLPHKIKKLVSLRYLQIWGCDQLTHMPSGIGQLIFLHKLDRFIVDSRDDLNWKPSAGLNELNGLNNLRGKLCIENLGYLKNGAGQCRAANLKGKQHLQWLQLQWNGNGDGDSDIVDQEKSMEGLEPHQNLLELNVSWYEGREFPSWLSFLTSLVHLHLYECRNCKNLPSLGPLTCLRSLVIKSASCMEFIEQNDVARGKGETDIPVFPSLTTLVLRDCPRLEGWWRRTNSKKETDLLPYFPCLFRLEILRCPKLTSIPYFPSIQGDLQWEENSWKPLQETMGCSTSSSSPLPLSKLESLSLVKIEDLESFLEEHRKNFTSLRSLEIISCPKLRTPGKGLGNLTSLRSLQIQNCPMLDTLPGKSLRNLTSLLSLEIVCCPRLISLPWDGFGGLQRLCFLCIENCESLYSLAGVFQHLTALEKLVINHCNQLDLSDLQFQSLRSLSSLTIRGLPKLKSFPQSIQHVDSLRELVIHSCPNLKLLPDEMGCLTSLQKLRILYCPQLSKRCQKHTGSDWHKIAHIPRITVDFRKIQKL